jgi:hypothetical protein
MFKTQTLPDSGSQRGFHLMTRTSRAATQLATQLATLALLALAQISTPISAHAGAAPKPGDSTIRACSRYGHGCVTASVRSGARGPEVRLPSGTWIHCAGDCRETLIETTVDFWDKQRDGAPDTAG